MGSSSSRPQENQQSNVGTQKAKDSNDDIQAFEIFIHEKYEELNFHEANILDKPKRYISPVDLFHIAICLPDYCESVHDMIRQAIRAESIREEIESPDYLNNFIFIERMDFSRSKILERCQFRYQLRLFLKNSNPSAIKPNSSSNSEPIPNNVEVTFQDIISLLRYHWVITNKNTIDTLITSFKTLSKSPATNFTEETRFHQILSQILGNENCEAFVPHRNLNWNEINTDFKNLKSKLSKQIYRCCMIFPVSNPFNKITIQGKVTRHGLCSNGSFLFVFTSERHLYTFLIYKGSIGKQMSKFILNESWKADDDTFLFCSQKWLYIKDNGITYQTPICNMINSDSITFNRTKRQELSNLLNACSNGATYIITNSDYSIQLFSAENDSLIAQNKSQITASLLVDNSIILLTNGQFIGLLGASGKIISVPYNSTNLPYFYQQEDSFLKNDDLDVIAATIDVLTCAYFSASHQEEKSIIYAYPYVGSSDNSIFMPKKDETDSSIGTQLFDYLSTCAFSSTIPENLITSSDSDLISIVKWIETNQNDCNLVKGLLLLFDLNLKKHDCRNIAQSLLPTLTKLINDKKYKRLVSVVLINNIDLFFDSFDNNLLNLIASIFMNSDKFNIYKSWLLTKLWQSSIISTIVINEQVLVSLFSDDWCSKPRNDKKYVWIVDFLLQVQQRMIEDAILVLEKDPLNLNESEVINSLCNFAQILFNHFHMLIEQTIFEQSDITKRKINSNSILFVLISNFVAITSPIMHCNKLALIITNEDGQAIIQLLNNEFIYDEKLQLFIEYFDMIYTLSLSGLIRGGSTYPCEIDYSWLIQANFNNGIRNLTPPDQNQIKYFLLSLDDEFMLDFIKNESEDIAYLYKKNRNFKPFKKDHEMIDRIVLAAVLHQTNTFDLLYDAKSHEKIKPELTFIINWVKKMRNKFNHALQQEIVENLNGEKQSDKLLTNMGILIVLDPALTDYQEKNLTERTDYLHRLELFIQNNEPYQFHKILKAVPKRIENILCGFDRINSLFQNIQNQTLIRIIIDGISRVDSFERLGYLLSNADLNQHALTTLTIFCMTCIDMISDFKQLSILEVLYTVLSNCKSFRETAITVMNQLSEFISYDGLSVDSFFMTVAGLAGATCTLPQSFYKIPDIGQAYIMKLIFSKKEDSSTFSISEIYGFIHKNNTERLILNDVWIKMLFTILNKCQFEESEAMFNLLIVIFGIISQCFHGQCIVFTSLPEIIYGIRYIMNSGNEISQLIQNILATITTDSAITDIFLLFTIIGADITDFSSFYGVRNQQGNWLKYTIDDTDCCLQIPISPFSKRHIFDINQINEPIQEEELNLEMSVPFETVISFWKICMKDQGSLSCRFYLETLNRYILHMNYKIPEEYLSILATNAKPYIDFHILSSKQTSLYINLNKSFSSQFMLLDDDDYGLGKIQQSNWTHLFAYNIMKYGSYTIHVILIDDAYLIIKNSEPVTIEFPSLKINNTDEKIEFEDNILNITILYDESTLIVNNKNFPVDENTSLEFIVKSTENISIEIEDQINFINSQMLSLYDQNDINVGYVNDIFETNEKGIEKFENNLDSIIPVTFEYVNAMMLEREGNNIFYNSIIDKVSFDKKLQFNGSSSTFKLMCRSDEIEICNQLKSVILAQKAINDPDSLDWPTCLSLIKSAVVAVGGFNKEKLFNGNFPYSLDEGFFFNCSLNYLQSRNVQTFFNSLKNLLKSQSFMNNLGNQLVIMARDRIYHSLIHKKDLVIIQPDQVDSYNKKEHDFLIDFADGSKGKLEIDQSGRWIVDTPIVFLLLLWIYIENCSTSEQRINAKLALIDCWLIKSPMINKYMPEFLSYIEKRMLFTPDDFNPIYIHHLSSLAVTNQNNEQIISFYEFEKKCFKLRSIHLLNLNEYPEMKIDFEKKNITPSKIIEILQLMKRYEKIDQFPHWNFIPLWRELAPFTLKMIQNDELVDEQTNYVEIINSFEEPLLVTITVTDSSECMFQMCDNKNLKNGKAMNTERSVNKCITHYIFAPNERKYLVWNCVGAKSIITQRYQILKDDTNLDEKLQNDIEQFAVKWTDSDTELLLSDSADFHLQCENFIWMIIDSLNMTELNKKFGNHVVQCKLACIFLINSINKLFSQFSQNLLSQKDDELRSLGRKNSRYLSYSNRKNEFKIVSGQSNTNLERRICYALIQMIGFIPVNVDNANKFMNGESNEISDSMIYQIAMHIKTDTMIRFKSLIWGIRFKGRDAIDASGVTNETITMSTQSFLSSKTGICIISPNCITNNNDEENDKASEIQVIPYPSKDEENIFDMLYAFGVILGSIIRGGIMQDIPFPLFIWNFLSGKEITKEDVYENDTRLKEEIESMKKGEMNDHPWSYRDWNNSIKPLNCCSNYTYVPLHLVDIYEKLVIDHRISSLKKYLIEIRKGLWNNQNIKDSDFLSGGLIMFLCQGKKGLDLDGIIKRVIFESGNNQLRNNLISILKEYDESMMRKFILFATACQKPPNFAVVPEYCITIEFKTDVDLTGLPIAHTCFRKVDMPAYPTIEIMRNKLNYAIENCAELDIG